MLALAAVGGAAFGSFINVLAYRLPRGESLLRPGSHCPSCGTPIKPYDNVPIIGWLLLRGHCRSCGERISPRYPIVEALTAALCVAVVATQSGAATIALDLLLVLVLVPVSLIDLDHRIIPNRIVGPAAVLAVLLGTVLDPGGELERLIAGACAGGFLLIAALLYPRGMGMGDVKLAGFIGLCLGRAVGPAMFIALIAGVVAGAVLAARHGTRAARKTAIPFGPFLAFGAIVAVFAGDAIVSAYLGSLG